MTGLEDRPRTYRFPRADMLLDQDLKDPRLTVVQHGGHDICVTSGVAVVYALRVLTIDPLRWTHLLRLLVLPGSLTILQGSLVIPHLVGRVPVFESTDGTHKSQEKRNRQTLVRAARNKAIRSELKTRAKNAVAAAEHGDAAAAAEALRIAQKRIDQAVAKGVLKKNTAARRKRNLVRRVQASSQ